ncbi:MFS transporter [bacterium]|nr:MFS transporter [bacterium]MBU2600294.1 MFS transporter [bacterium]
MSKQNKIRKSLKFSLLDGVFASCMVGLTTDYITPFALVLKATNKQIGLLNALPNLISSCIQLRSADLVEKLKSRKKIINIFVLLQVLMMIPIFLLPYLFKQPLVSFFIILITLFVSFGAFAGPPWSSLMADYIPPKSRGKYFGWRNKVLTIVTILSSFLAGFILHVLKCSLLTRFMIIFGLAFICRFISWYFLTLMYEPPFKIEKEAYFSFFDFIKGIKKSNFAKFVIFVSLLSFCINLAAPFFSVFMLRDLLSLFFISTILRGLVVTLFLGKIKEVRRTEKIKSQDLFYSIIGIKPIIQELRQFSRERD